MENSFRLVLRHINIITITTAISIITRLHLYAHNSAPHQFIYLSFSRATATYLSSRIRIASPYSLHLRISRLVPLALHLLIFFLAPPYHHVPFPLLLPHCLHLQDPYTHLIPTTHLFLRILHHLPLLRLRPLTLLLRPQPSMLRPLLPLTIPIRQALLMRCEEACHSDEFLCDVDDAVSVRRGEHSP